MTCSTLRWDCIFLVVFSWVTCPSLYTHDGVFFVLFHSQSKKNLLISDPPCLGSNVLSYWCQDIFAVHNACIYHHSLLLHENYSSEYLNKWDESLTHNQGLARLSTHF